MYISVCIYHLCVVVKVHLHVCTCVIVCVHLGVCACMCVFVCLVCVYNTCAQRYNYTVYESHDYTVYDVCVHNVCLHECVCG